MFDSRIQNLIGRRIPAVLEHEPARPIQIVAGAVHSGIIR
jgi:hypothetical protein